MNRKRIFFVVIGIALIGLGCSSMHYAKTSRFDGSRFYNLDPKVKGEKDLLQVIKWRLTTHHNPWVLPVENLNKPKPELFLKIKKNECVITWINHATELIQFAGLTVLTDPIFSERASPLSWFGPKRARKPGVALRALPKIDVVVISHNHYDHMDVSSIKQLCDQYDPLFIVPLGNASILRSQGVRKIVELDWWQSHPIGFDNTITLTPAQHWSGRGIFDHCKALWGGYLIESQGLKVFFAGDTGYNTHFKILRERYGEMDVSLLPIGSYEPRWFMGENHLNPQEAVQAHLDLGSKMSIGMHFGTFQLSSEGIDDPVLMLGKSIAAHHLTEQTFIAPQNGQTVVYSKKAK